MSFMHILFLIVMMMMREERKKEQQQQQQYTISTINYHLPISKQKTYNGRSS